MRQGSHVTKKKRKKYLRCNHWKRMQRYKPSLCFESFNFFFVCCFCFAHGNVEVNISVTKYIQ